MLLDVVHLVRTLRKSPTSAAAAILTLALTLGAGASIFAVVDAVLLTPPPLADPAQLVVLGERPTDEPTAAPRAVPYATFDAWRERAGSLASLEALDGTNLTLTGLGAAVRLRVTDVTPGFFALLGVTPARGRTFTPDDVGQPVVIISEAFWRDTLASDPQAIGRQLVLGAQPHTIVGVLPERFGLAFSPADLWRPLPLTRAQALASGYRVGALARLAPGRSAADLAAVLDDVSRRSTPAADAVVTSLATALSGGARRTLGLLGAAAALAVLIAFTNLAGLLVVRSIDRRRELAVRTALGARRSEIARQVLLEAQALVILGTIGGALLALWLTPPVGRLALEPFSDLARRGVTVSWRAIGVVAVVASGLAWICAALPAAAATRRNVVDLLRRGATFSPHDLRMRRVFVAGEVALAFVLLVSVTLLGRSLTSALAVNPGFNPNGVLIMQVSLPAATYTAADRITGFYAALQRDLQPRLGTAGASIIDELPLTGDRGRRLVSATSAEPAREVVVRATAPGYFDVMQIPIVDGRAFDVTDTADVPPRVVISASLAARLFASDRAVGRRLWMAPTQQLAEIVGVVGDVKHRALDEGPSPTLYVSSAQEPSRSTVVVVRTGMPDADAIRAVRDAVARLDPSLPVYGTRAMGSLVAASPGVPERRVLTAAFSGFALLGIVLGGIGLFGVVAHDVACRRAELALRMALGADPMRILRRITAQGALIVGAGLAAGGVLSIWAARALAGVLFGTTGLDVVSIGLPAVVLLVAGAAAILPAARRAARTDLLITLRSE